MHKVAVSAFVGANAPPQFVIHRLDMRTQYHDFVLYWDDWQESSLQDARRVPAAESGAHVHEIIDNITSAKDTAQTANILS